jgi:DNA-binding HxlR family transcriptional regulator
VNMYTAYIMNLSSQLWGKKWRAAIMWQLKDGPLRFSEIKKTLPSCSVKMLSEALQELESNNVIKRVVYSTTPVKVTYELHSDLYPLIEAQKNYYDLLAHYFLNNKEHYNIPPEIVELLKDKLITS